MEALPNWEAFQECVGRISRTGPKYSTNLYGGRDQIEHWCAIAPPRALVTDGAVLVLRKDRDFYRVYHVAESHAALTAALAMLPGGSYTSDLVGQGDALDLACAAYGSAGFGHHAFLRRMSRTQVPGVFGEGEAELARPEDASAVAAFLERLLDRFTEQLPEISELELAALSGRLLVVRRSVELSGMLMYDIKGQLAHLRFWHVDRDARGEGVGRQLMSSFLSRCAQARRIVLWVIGDNERSVSIYRHYGFADDGLLDRIMLLHKD